MTLYQLDEKTHKVVPIEATPDMKTAAAEFWLDEESMEKWGQTERKLAGAYYGAMLTASPEVLPLDIAKISESLKQPEVYDNGGEYAYHQNCEIRKFNDGVDALAAAIAKGGV